MNADKSTQPEAGADERGSAPGAWMPLVLALVAIIPNILVSLQSWRTNTDLVERSTAEIKKLTAEAEGVAQASRTVGIEAQALSSKRIPRTSVAFVNDGLTNGEMDQELIGKQCLLKGGVIVTNKGNVPVMVQTVTFDVLGVETSRFPVDADAILDLSYNNLIAQDTATPLSYVSLQKTSALRDAEILLHPEAFAKYAWAFAVPDSRSLIVGLRARVTSCEIICKGASVGGECSEGTTVSKNCYENDFATTTLAPRCASAFPRISNAPAHR